MKTPNEYLYIYANVRPESQCTLQVQLLHVVCTPAHIFILFFEENFLILKAVIRC
ncbi:hypothetical protein Syun_003980 [Stephania yunnanensis]|uniref:Uncharacterized protein n=1 Tax=Stephania yunnanensis TaxID=152371 RepID=A0AAP0L256_9MAGN